MSQHIVSRRRDGPLSHRSAAVVANSVEAIVDFVLGGDDLDEVIEELARAASLLETRGISRTMMLAYTSRNLVERLLLFVDEIRGDGADGGMAAGEDWIARSREILELLALAGAGLVPSGRPERLAWNELASCFDAAAGAGTDPWTQLVTSTAAPSEAWRKEVTRQLAMLAIDPWPEPTRPQVPSWVVVGDTAWSVQASAPGESPHDFEVVLADGTITTAHVTVALTSARGGRPGLEVRWRAPGPPRGSWAFSLFGEDESIPFARFFLGRATVGRTILPATSLAFDPARVPVAVELSSTTEDIPASELLLDIEEQGGALASALDWAHALPFYREAVAVRPDAAWALNNLALAHANVGDVERAIELYRNATELTPNEATPHAGLATVLRRRGQLDDARNELEKALRSTTRDDLLNFCYRSLADIHRDQQVVDEAAKAYRQALEHDPRDAESHFQLAILLYRSDDFHAAELEWYQAFQLDEAHLDALANAGLAAWKRGSRDEAALVWRDVLGRDGNHREALVNSVVYELYKASMARSREMWRHYDRARELLRRLVRIDPTFHDARGHLERLESIVPRGAIPRLVASLRLALGLNPFPRRFDVAPALESGYATSKMAGSGPSLLMARSSTARI